MRGLHIAAAAAFGIFAGTTAALTATFNLVYQNNTGQDANDFHLDINRGAMVTSATTGFYDDVSITAAAAGQMIDWTVDNAEIRTSAGGFHGFQITFDDGDGPGDITDAYFTFNGDRLMGGGAVLVNQTMVNNVPTPGAGLAALSAMGAFVVLRRRKAHATPV